VSYRTELGREGEDRVARYLTDSGWLVIERNWRTRLGEIDIIVLRRDTIAFVEVKTWPHGVGADLELVIGHAKRKRMVETAKCFLGTHRQYSGMYVRFDVFLISSDPLAGGSVRYRHLKDAISERV
jgi:putative endonuclease